MRPAEPRGEAVRPACWKRLGTPGLKHAVPSTTRLFVYGQQEVRSAGRVVLSLQRGHRVFSVACELVDRKSFHFILGAQTCQAMKMLMVNDNDKINSPPNSVMSKIQSIQWLLKDPLLAKFPMAFIDRIGMLPGMYTICIHVCETNTASSA